MRMLFLTVICTLFITPLIVSTPLWAQSSIEEPLEKAFQNAKKGMYWALSNIPEKKAQADNDLIDQDKLLSTVKLSKEINGLRIESTGFFESTGVKLTIFRSTEWLLKEGYLRPDTVVVKADTLKQKKETKKRSRKQTELKE